MQNYVFPYMFVHLFMILCAFSQTYAYVLMCECDLCICVASEYMCGGWVHVCVGAFFHFLQGFRKITNGSNVPLQRTDEEFALCLLLFQQVKTEGQADSLS